MANFTLSELEEARVKRWVKKAPQKKLIEVGAPVVYIFIQTGIGVVVQISCGDELKDITDYDSW